MKNLIQKILLTLSAAFIGLGLLTTTPAQASVDPYIKGVSLINLIATPEKFQGKVVRIFGYLSLDFEGHGIYLHEEDYDRHIYKNGLWVSFKEGALTDEKMKALDGKYVLIEGTFDAEKQGHMGLWSGSVNEIYRAQEWGN